MRVVDRPQSTRPDRVLINLVGAPGSGKSTLATAYCKANPRWTLLTIDEYMAGGLDHIAAWEAVRTHARYFPRVIVESSGLSMRLLPLLKRSVHVTVHVTSADAKARRESRAKPEIPAGGAGGTHDELALATKRLPDIYPKAITVRTDGVWDDALLRFSCAMSDAEARALAGGDPAPKRMRPPSKRKKKDPQKAWAQHQVYIELRAGRMQKQPCEVCGAAKVEGHHESYEDALAVHWLCHKHHKVADRARRQRLDRSGSG